MTSKTTTTTKFEVKKFVESQFLVVEDVSNIVARERGHKQGLAWY